MGADTGTSDRLTQGGLRPRLRVPSEKPRRLAVPTLLFFGGMVACLLWWRVLPASFFLPDTTDYAAFHRPAAMSLLEGKAYTVDGSTFAHRYPPGYPAIVAAAVWFSRVSGINERSVILALNVICLACSAVLLYAIASTRAGALAGVAV